MQCVGRRLLQGSSCHLALAARRPACSAVPRHHPRHQCRSMAASCSSSTAADAAAAATADAAVSQQPPVQQQQQQHQQEAAAAAAAGDGSSASAPRKKVKRNVALHIGYVGTQYTGLQANRQLPQLATVEGVLEQAILRAGLIAEVNFGDFRKTKWSRSSRTDKGVHSLATVIGLRILIASDEDYETDKEGIAYAQAINEHLPDDVCVFAVQRTNKSFNARRWCGSRTYEYYLPASCLGLDTLDGSSPEDQARLALLREVLAAYCGYLPYHNFAGNRAQYVGQKDKAKRRKERREARTAAAASASEDPGSPCEPDAADTQQAAQVSSSAPDPAAAGAQKGRSGKGTAPADEEEDAEAAAAEAALYAAAAAAYTGEGPVPPELQWRQQVRFLDAPDPDDPIVKSHYRMMRSFTADDPRPLVPGGVPCLRLEVCGDSFMLHQIRNMVGTAAAIVRGIIPRELLEVALSAPGRVSLPRAPPHSLLLYGSQFSNFPAGWGLDTPLVARFTGARLELRPGGQAMRQAFRQRVFDAAINELLQHPDWELWSTRMLPRYTYAAEDVAPVVQAHTVWRGELLAKRAAAAAKKEAAEAAAAAAAAAEAAAEAEAASRAPGGLQAFVGAVLRLFTGGGGTK